jgi:ferredoxin
MEEPKKNRIAKIIVDREGCIGAASCVAVAGRTYYMDDENKAVVIEPWGDDDEMVLLSAQACPTLAIRLIDVDGNQIYP